MPKSFIVLIIFFFIFPHLLPAQEKTDSNTIDVSSIHYARSIASNVSWTSKKMGITDDSIPYFNFSEKLPSNFNLSLPVSIIEKNIYFSFSLSNNADSSSEVFFFAGLYCKRIQLFTAHRNDPTKNIKVIKDSAGNSVSTSGLMMLKVDPHENVQVYAKVKLLSSGANTISPRLINKNFINDFKNNQQVRKSAINLFTYMVSGILLMMIFYSFASYIQNFNVEFLYYAAYVFLTASLLFLKSYMFASHSTFNYFFEEYFDFIMQGCGFVFYLLFFRKFLDTRQKYHFLEKLLSFSNWVILVSLTAFSIIYFSGDNFTLWNTIENGLKEFLLVIGVIFIVYGLTKKDILIRYLITGQICLIVFSLISLLLIITPLHFTSATSQFSIFNDGLFYYEIGLMLELTFFLLGLAYKNKMEIITTVKEREQLKLDNERKEFEKQMAILEAKQEERNRISADMHDELGSGVTAIHLMSEIVKSKMKENTLPEIEKISHSAGELLNKMNTIIWTMISSNDSVESLITYIRIYALEFFENTPIDCHFNMPDPIPAKDMNGEKRRNIFLCVKEALNNALKHSNATNLTIDITVSQKLIISILDDGIGINLDNLRKFSNGLTNMKKRMHAIEGSFTIENHLGTKVIFELDL